ncbi:phosphate ABC transporter membrane protein 1, PhoT family (TC 3.A.1.7.1) [Caldanaerovirga acetigignens]|jgi:phosphate transport system permease protein|uniref:Phosphate transport system permease protein n=1 Tax=Caldanaerovirga acetigignens TaxID=447595 RepID=A0A1M7ITQ8_9FIRM|nr:phosphate ABC transporter permease subunit PstC [Caldanaerovirga acetigignens]SHM43998.1 phosphate ABC transporter membrane protein 1, PhoT family (TC 3.A.1.7.1) [Caldanaerovirga acetigignens]
MKEKFIKVILASAASASVLIMIGIVFSLLEETAGFFKEVTIKEFLTQTRWTPLFTPAHYGILPLICGTALVTLIAVMVAAPVGLASALYLSEYAPDSLRRVVKPVLEILAGIPSIVYGYFALTFITPIIRSVFPQANVFNALSAGIVMGIMLIPMVSSLSEDAMLSVPNSLREAAYALGATKLEVSCKVVLPAATSGIVASFILAISRAIGETMIVALAAGSTPKLTFNPLESIQTMTAFIVQVLLGDAPFGSIEYKSVYAVASVLFAMTLSLNIVGNLIVRRYREVY